jgi:hypothetical protein
MAVWSHRNSSGSSVLGTTNWVITKPTNTANGDLLVTAIVIQAGSVSTVPSGWTQLDTLANGVQVWYKIAASEGASWTWSMDANRSGGWCCTAMTPAYGTPALDVNGRTTGQTGASISAPAQTAKYPNSLVVGVFGARGASGTVTWTAPTGMTERQDQGGTGSGVCIDTVEQASAGTTGVKTATASPTDEAAASGWLAVFYVPAMPLWSYYYEMMRSR